MKMARRTDVKSKGRRLYAHFDPDIASKYDEDDADLCNRINSRYNKNGSDGQNISRNHDDRKFQKDSLAESGCVGTKEVMYSVEVKGCGQCSPHEIITEIQGYTTPFIPFFPIRTEKGDVTFLVKNSIISTSLQQLSRRVKNPRKHTNLLILTKKKTCSFNKLPYGHREIIEFVCKSRLSDDKKILDLSNFSSDPYFKTKGIMVSLQRIEVCNAIVDFVFNNCSLDVISLSLKSTGLKNLCAIASMVYAIPMLKVLDLSCNMFEKITELSKIRLWKLEELFLENTTATSVFTDSSTYSRLIQGYFPYLKKLDGIVLNDNDENIDSNDKSEILIKPSFFPSKDIETILGMFITQYFDIFDGPNGATNRKQLTDAYDENCIFSYVFDSIDDGNHDTVSKSFETLREPNYKPYRRTSHNFNYEHKFSNRRVETYGKGNLETLAMLCRLPLTEHVRESFVVDVCMATSTVVMFTIQGLLNDGEEYFTSSKSKINLKYFTRSFVCLPRGETGLSITSDILTVYPVDEEGLSKYETYLMNNQPSNLENTSTPVQTAPQSFDINDPEVRAAMVKSFMEQSGMNEVWTRRCLEDSNWNYTLAGDKFLSIKDSIPPEAFIK